METKKDPKSIDSILKHTVTGCVFGTGLYFAQKYGDLEPDRVSMLFFLGNLALGAIPYKPRLRYGNGLLCRTVGTAGSYILATEISEYISRLL